MARKSHPGNARYASTTSSARPQASGTRRWLIKRFENFGPEGSLTKQQLFDALIDRGFDVMEIKPFGYVWLMQDKKIKF